MADAHEPDASKEQDMPRGDGASSGATATWEARKSDRIIASSSTSAELVRQLRELGPVGRGAVVRRRVSRPA
jgi:hypothetical protein